MLRASDWRQVGTSRKLEASTDTTRLGLRLDPLEPAPPTAADWRVPTGAA